MPPPGAGLPFTLAGLGAGAFSNSFAQGAATAAATQGILSGLESVATRAYSVGANIGQAILSGVLSGTLGRTGTALSSIFGATVGTGGALLTGGLRAGAGLVGAGVTGAFGAATLPLNLASAAATGVGGVVGGIGGFIGQISSGLTSLFQMFLKGVTDLVTQVGDAFGKIGELGGAIFKGVLDIFADVLETAKDVSRQVRAISQNAGVSQGQAGKVFNAFQFAGGDTKALAGIYSQPLGALTIGMRAKMLGLPDPTQDPEGFILGAAGRRQQMTGPVGSAIFGAMLGPQLGGALGDSLGMSQSQLQRNFALSKSFELPKGTVELGSDAIAVSAAFGALGTNLKLVLGSVLVPLMPRINEAFSWIISHKDDIVGAITTVGSYLVKELPVLILRGGAMILRGVGTVMTGLGTFLTTTFQSITATILKNLPDTLKAFDQFGNAMETLAFTGISLSIAISQGVQNLMGHPLVQTAMKAFGIAPTGATGGPAASSAASIPTPSMNPGQAILPPGTTNYSQTTGAPSARSGVGALIGGAAGALYGMGKNLYNFTNATQDAFVDVTNGNLGGAWDNVKGAVVGAYRNGWSNVSNQARYGAAYGYRYGPGGAPGMAPGGTMPPGTTSGTPNGGSLIPVPGQLPGDAYTNAQAWLRSHIPAFNTQGSQKEIGGFIGDIAARGKEAGQWMLDNKGKVMGGADSLDRMASKWENDLSDIANNTRETADNTAKGIQAQLDFLKSWGPMIQAIVSRTSATLSEDATMNILRAG